MSLTAWACHIDFIFLFLVLSHEECGRVAETWIDLKNKAGMRNQSIRCVLPEWRRI